jgi:RNA polymerase sigma-70 factor, ECF subfamily
MSNSEPHKDDPRSDGDLARLVADGDTRSSQEAADVLIRRYQRLVRSFLLRITGRQDLADDLAQDTFVRLLKNAGRFDPKYPMRTWLMTIARRLSINYNRKADQRVGSTEYGGQQTNDHGPAQKAQAKDDNQSQRQMINQALQQLSESQRTCVTLFHQQEMSIEQIAEAIDIPVGTVKSHLHRGRAAMRKILEHLVPQDDA